MYIFICKVIYYNQFKERMGNDGGDIPRRKQLVKTRQKIQVASTQSIARGRSRYCNLTNQPLKKPLAVCRLGCIYNYQNLLAALLKKTLASKYAYIRKLTDIKKVIVENTAQKSQCYFICPITKLQYNGFNKFVAIWKCGHVLSRKAFKQVKVESKDDKCQKCIICDTEYSDKDIIDLNLQGPELEKKRAELIAKVQQKKAKKQEQKQPTDIGNEPGSQPSKKVKKDVHVSNLDRLGGQFRDVLRQREKFKQLFSRP